MKRVAREIRVLVTDEDKKKILSRDTAYVHNDKEGIYEHCGKLYRYLCSDYHIDYFEEIVKPLEIGLNLDDVEE
ncbi:MAG: hypothetical protein PHQ43_15420 [Dehalococcoidales bacterium]|nr:hypothetical protein [Dehalococcoidales bacterium]